MLTGRGYAVIATGVALWIGSRLLGAPDLHMIAVGLLVLAPAAVALVWWLWQDVQATRRMSARRAFPGTRIRVDVELHNRRRIATPLLLLEDRLPSQLGRSARATLSGIGAGRKRRISYEVALQSRGRYTVGPLLLDVTDPFLLARQRIELPTRDEILVYPRVEDLATERRSASGAGAGESSARQLFRSGHEFYTIRAYETGQDLRKIHWPSTARTGELMIRQEEAARRSTAAVLLDSRVASVGGRSATFERAVSAAGSIGLYYLRSGYTLHLATPEMAPRVMTAQEMLEALAVIEPSSRPLLGAAVRRMSDPGAGRASLVVITHVPLAEEMTQLLHAGQGYGSRVALMVQANDPRDLGSQPRAELHAWSESARAALMRAGWQVILLSPSSTLRDRWQLSAPTRPRPIASS